MLFQAIFGFFGVLFRFGVWRTDTVEGRDGIQRDLDRLERWSCVILTRFSKVNCKVLDLVREIPNIITGWEEKGGLGRRA